MKALLTAALALLVAALSAQAGGPGHWQRRSYQGMSYWLYTPASAGSANALMLNLHGCGQTADDLKELGNWESAAEKHQMIVAIPDVPNGGVFLGCWNYFGRNHTQTNNDNGPLLGLTQSLLDNAALRVDGNQIYASGLSSGATQALLLGCLRPDLFSGLASNSGPAIGSDVGEISSPTTTAAQAAHYCKQLAGDKASYFARQKTVVIRGDEDLIVNPEHAAINSHAMASLYGASGQTKLDPTALPGSNTAGGGALFSDASGIARVAVIINNGLQHNWAAGNNRDGQPTRSVNPKSVDLPEFLGTFFAPNAQ